MMCAAPARDGGAGVLRGRTEHGGTEPEDEGDACKRGERRHREPGRPGSKATGAWAGRTCDDPALGYL